MILGIVSVLIAPQVCGFLPVPEVYVHLRLLFGSTYDLYPRVTLRCLYIWSLLGALVDTVTEDGCMVSIPIADLHLGVLGFYWLLSGASPPGPSRQTFCHFWWSGSVGPRMCL